MTNFFNLFTINCDAAKPSAVYSQDATSHQLEALVELHDNIMFYLVIILFAVAWIFTYIISNYFSSKSSIGNKYLNHETFIDLIWSSSPVLGLICIFIWFTTVSFLLIGDETDPFFNYIVSYSEGPEGSEIINGRFIANSNAPDIPLEFDPDNSLDRRNLNLTHEHWNVGYSKSRITRFVYDQNDHSGTNLQKLFDGTNRPLVQKGDIWGIRIRMGSHSDIDNNIAKPLVVAKKAQALIDNKQFILSRDRSALTGELHVRGNPYTYNTDMIALYIYGKDN